MGGAPTLRLTGNPPDPAILESIAGALRNDPSIAALVVGRESSVTSEGIMAAIAFAQPSTPGAAVNAATTLFLAACAQVGVGTDELKEVVVERADVDPRSL